MPYSLKRKRADNPKVKEWKSKTYENGYVEIVKYDTIEEAKQNAVEWGGDPEIVEVPKEIGTE